MIANSFHDRQLVIGGVESRVRVLVQSHHVERIMPIKSVGRKSSRWHGVEVVKERAVGSLVVRAPDSRPEGLGSMSVPPNILRVLLEYVLVKSVGPKVLWAESRVQGTEENFPPLQFHA
ncbi:uncharacterized protein TNCV_3194131 [Trichonephila clavipes]|uniref:Uncharacterized protein n=1 Tax=Trichonephila clavipes TaxID=2585209 RepID=A0A8X6RAM5_TRICX|nr:uncharacterized protein TNCV_3194131 [Trichonephila clavipes]